MAQVLCSVILRAPGLFIQAKIFKQIKTKYEKHFAEFRDTHYVPESSLDNAFLAWLFEFLSFRWGIGSICSRFGNAVVYPGGNVGKERGLTKQLKIEASWDAAQKKEKKKTRRKREREPSPSIIFTLAVFPNRTPGSGYIKPTMAFSI